MQEGTVLTAVVLGFLVPAPQALVHTALVTFVEMHGAPAQLVVRYSQCAPQPTRLNPAAALLKPLPASSLVGVVIP